METPHQLRRRAADLEAIFETACSENGYRDRWAAYRAEEAGAVWPESVRVAHDAWTDAVHRFYAARDGERGFLGARGG
jgi:hypothetical protein